MSESGPILRRSNGIVLSDGGLLALAASLPAGRGEHGDEEDSGRPLRGAGTLISSSRVRREGLDAEIAFFRWSVEGREGLGTYEVARNG